MASVSSPLMIWLTIKNKGKRIYVVETTAKPRKKKEKKVRFNIEVPKFVPPVHLGPWCQICQAPLYFYERQDICIYCEKGLTN